MTQIKFRIFHSEFTINCQEGEEVRLRNMGDEVVRRVEHFHAMGVKGALEKLLLLVAIQLADELYDMQLSTGNAQIGGEKEVPSSSQQVHAVNAPHVRLDDNMNIRYEQLLQLAEQAEAIADQLEQG